MIKVGIITASDKGFQGKRKDESSEVIKRMIEKIGGRVEAYAILPDEKELLQEKLIDFCDRLGLDLVLTTGGTGFSPRDVTPEATQAVVERLVPGISEAMRRESMKKTPRAMLTRGISGIRGRTLIVNLPGSPKAVQECLEVILPAIPHGVEVLRGEVEECALVKPEQK
ncbi:MogA/MoaB family molybdenum cofactor biosynthesis protein [Calderihabitans maritimus]|uniref:Molybdenum cofactor biosynthesis protein n=1 Tax=Calderihabitans maritimus TaxID=1246530 RepID=A0A1Z5HVL2_9FIRM|nr:MogA/MoaB family molybdenum cofactor biosynthesis protein [Calderihabitans maritimus]GAW93361.1 molybdenum cofactor biosynthesis protein [Calderihabitans maritimus]